MANTLTNLAPDLYAALDVVSRELVGMIPAVSRDSRIDAAPLNQTIRSFVTPSATSFNAAAGQLPADNGDTTITNKTVSITKDKYAPFRFTGEDQASLNTGAGYNPIRQDLITQAMRVLTNEIESDLTGLHVEASRAVLPAGTTLFDAANYKDVANVRQVLVDNGAPRSDMHLILDTTSGAALRGNAQYAGADTAGRETILRQGVLLDVHGMSLRESDAIVQDFTKGDGSTAAVTGVEPVGETSLAITITNEIVAGDIISIAGDTNKYVVLTGTDGDGTIVIGAPGLKVATVGSDVITIEDQSTRNMAFSRNAIFLATRTPFRPVEGDLARDKMIIQDPISQLAFEVTVYEEYRRVRYEIAMAWGFAMIKPEHCALLVD